MWQYSIVAVVVVVVVVEAVVVAVLFISKVLNTDYRHLPDLEPNPTNVSQCFPSQWTQLEGSLR